MLETSENWTIMFYHLGLPTFCMMTLVFMFVVVINQARDILSCLESGASVRYGSGSRGWIHYDLIFKIWGHGSMCGLWIQVQGFD